MEITKIKSLEEISNSLNELQVNTKGDAIRLIALISAVKKHEKALKEKAYDELDKHKDLDFEGFEVVKVSPKVKVYNSNEEIKDLESKIKEKNAEVSGLKKNLEKERIRAGYTEEDGVAYYKAVYS